jgi:hypothetical protein
VPNERLVHMVRRRQTAANLARGVCSPRHYLTGNKTQICHTDFIETLHFGNKLSGQASRVAAFRRTSDCGHSWPLVAIFIISYRLIRDWNPTDVTKTASTSPTPSLFCYPWYNISHVELNRGPVVAVLHEGGMFCERDRQTWRVIGVFIGRIIGLGRVPYRRGILIVQRIVEPRCGAVHHPTNTGHFTPQSAGSAASLGFTDVNANAWHLRSQRSRSEGEARSFRAPD